MNPPVFFDYECDACQAPVCERMLLFALAHDYEEETLCLDCLVEKEGVDKVVFVEKTKTYIQSRNCFKKPWDAFDASGCPLLEKGSCFCQDR
jgi:hypothetical protein